MAPKTWTPQRNEQLMLLFVNKIKFDHKVRDELVEQWKLSYRTWYTRAMVHKQTADTFVADDEFQPTARAIQEQVKALKKRAPGTTSDSTPQPKAKAASKIGHTPSKRGAPKTPTSSAKRARVSRMSDDDLLSDADDDENLDFSNLQKRETPKRRSTALKKSYADDSSDEVDELITSSKKQVPGSNSNLSSGLDGQSPSTVLAQHGGRTSIARSKNDPPKLQGLNFLGEDSDEDTFKPLE